MSRYLDILYFIGENIRRLGIQAFGYLNIEKISDTW